jgi:hypothetical protein
MVSRKITFSSEAELGRYVEEQRGRMVQGRNGFRKILDPEGMVRANVARQPDGSLSGSEFATPFHTREAYSKGHVGQPIERRDQNLRGRQWPQGYMLD